MCVRKHKIGLTLSDEELEMIQTAAAEKDLRPATYCKMVILGVIRDERKESAKSN